MTADATTGPPRARRVLVTGGAGFVGANVVRRLAGSWRVTVLDDLSAGSLAYLEGLDVEFVEGDVLDRSLIAQQVEGQDAIVHLAAQTGVPGSLENPERDCRVNVLGTLGLLDALRNASRVGSRPARFVFASSNAPLGRQEPPATEDKAPLPVSPYGASKLAAEAYCLAYHGSWGLGTVALRFANLYGPYSLHKESVVAKFFKDVLRDGSITIDGDGGQTRDFIYVEDLAAAVELALDASIGGEVFQIATGRETSIAELAGMVEALANRSVDRTFAEARRGDIRRNYSSIEKARDVLGWQPRVGLEEGLARTWSWFQEALEARDGGS